MAANRTAVAAGTASITVAEQALLTSVPVNTNMPPGSQGNLVEATITGVGAASVTGITFRIRAGAGTGGAVLAGPVTIPVAGAVGYAASLNYLDGVNLVAAGVQYTVTAAAVGAAAGAWTGTLAGEPCTATS